MIAFLESKDRLLSELQQSLINHEFKSSDYNIYTKMERGKNRLIADLPLYPDRIVHCAVAMVIEDDLNRTLIHQTHASIKGHGTHTAMMDVRKNIHNDPKLKYCLSMDIHHCYASIPPERIKLMFRDYIKDAEMLDLIDIIIDSYTRTGYPGIALGGRLSPLMANLYLSPLDHYLKEVRHVHVMERYMDNYFILGYSKPWLHSIRKDIIANLGELGLTINGNWSIRPIDSTHRVDMIGWVVYSDHVLIRKKTKLRMKKCLTEMERKLDHCRPLSESDKGCLASYMGSLRWFDSYNLRKRLFDPVVEKQKEWERWSIGLASYRYFVFYNQEVYQ